MRVSSSPSSRMRPSSLERGAAVHTQVIRQLLPVKGDGKGAAALLQSLGGKVRDKSAPDGLGAGAENAVGEGPVLPGENGHQVAQQLPLPRGARVVFPQQSAQADGEDFAVLGGHGGHQQGPAGEGVSFPKDLAGPHAA